jgi:hypothetical protein
MKEVEFVKDTGEVKFLGLTEKQKKEWKKKRDAARKSPPPYAIVQHPEVYK